MNNQAITNTLERFKQLRSTESISQVDMLQAIDQAEDVLHQLISTHSDEMSTALKVAEQQESRINILIELNRNLIGQMVIQQTVAD